MFTSFGQNCFPIESLKKEKIVLLLISLLLLRFFLSFTLSSVVIRGQQRQECHHLLASICIYWHQLASIGIN